MIPFVLIKRYARALLDLAGKEKTIEDVLQALGNLVHAIQNVPELNEIFNNPLVPPEQKKNLASSVTSNKLVLRFVTLLARRKRLHLLPEIEMEMRLMRDKSEGLINALIKTPIPLNESEKREVESRLSLWKGEKIKSRFVTDPELIGGILIRMGDQLLDLTVRGRLDNIQKILLYSSN